MNGRDANGNGHPDYGRHSPNGLFQCLDYGSDLFDDADLNHGAVLGKLNGHGGSAHDRNGGVHVKLEPSLKIEPPSTPGTPTSAPPFSGGGAVVWPAPPPAYSHCPPAYPHAVAVANGMMRPSTANSVPAPSMFAAHQQHQQQPSPASAMPADSTSFLQFGGSYRDHRRASDGDLAFDDPRSPMPYFDPMRAGDFGSPGMGAFADARQTDGFGVGVPADSSAANGQSNAQMVGGVAPGSQKAFVPCKVCGDKASGYHYGVTSCEGCKGFFRRSIQKQIEYRCLRDGKCMVFRLNRNRCQYCRFKKCLAVGMSRDSVRYGRVPKRSRERLQDDARVSSMTGDAEADSELEKKQLALYDIILSVSQAHHSNCNYTDDKIKNLSHRPMHFPLEQCQLTEADALGSTGLLEQHKIVMWQTLSAKVLPEIQHVVEFAKRIPGFADLEQDDQLILIKAGFFEVWLIRVARMFNPQSCSLTFCDGSVVSRDQLEVIYNSDLVSAMAVFTTSFNNLHLNDGEIGLFSAIILLSSDRPKVKHPTRVDALQEKLVEALKLQLSRSRSSDPQLFGNLIAKLTELRTVGMKHTEVLEWFQSNCHRLSLPALYAEIYNIHMDDTANRSPPSNGDVAALPNGGAHGLHPPPYHHSASAPPPNGVHCSL